MSSIDSAFNYDLKYVVASNRLVGLWRLMAGFRTSYAAANVSLAVAATAKVATFMLLRYFVDDVLGQPQASARVAWVALAFVGLAVVEGLSSFWSATLAAHTAEGITLRLRNYLFDHLQRLPFAYHDRTPTGDLIERCTSDVDAVRRFYADQAIGIGRIATLFIITFTALLQLNVTLALLSVGIIPVLIAMSMVFFKRVSKVYDALQAQEAVVSTTLQENLTGVRVVKAFGRQQFERDKFQRDSWEKFLRGKRFMTMHALYWPLSDLLCGVQTLVGVGAGARMAMSGAISVGGYLAYTGLLIWVVWPMRNLGRFIVQMSSGLVSYQRLSAILAEPREPLLKARHWPDGSFRGDVVFDKVSFVYSSGYRALDEVSFRCAPGEVIALLGSTGSGKTTLVNLLPRFYEYTSGSILLDGIELRELARHILRRQIGIVEQEPFLFSRSIRENITYGVHRKVDDREVVKAAQAAAIHDDILTFPRGYETIVGERGVMLSGGQKQRLAIARTLLKDPRILILDDSTSSVDVETEHEIRAALQRLMQGRTTFIIAHRIQSVMNADQIIVFDKGRVVQMGKHDELIAQDGMYRRIFELQTRIDAELEQEASGVGLL